MFPIQGGKSLSESQRAKTRLLFVLYREGDPSGLPKDS